MMLMSYLGALKGWIYTVMFQFWPPSIASIRTPVLLIGTATLWLFFVFLRRIAGDRAAVAGCVLLATDPTFLLTTCFDWGPVALQHLLTVAGAALALGANRASGRRSLAMLGGAFLLFGMGLWDKAIFSWVLAGLAAATLVVFPRELLRSLSVKRVAAASVGFALGALPLILYNVKYPFETFRSNATYSADDLPGKARLVRHCVDGSSLLGWLVLDDYEGVQPLPPQNAVDRASRWVSSLAGQPRGTLMWSLCLLSLALLPVLWWRHGTHGPVRILLFALVFLAVTWLAMALTNGAGGSVHHVVLLWPFPHLFAAVSLSSAAALLPRYGRALLIVLVVAVLASNLLVINQHYTQIMRNGGGLAWTDAIFPLAAYMRTVPARYVYIVDWGVLDSLRLLGRGSIPVRVGYDLVNKPVPGDEDRAEAKARVSSPDNVFIGYTEGNEFFPGTTKKMEELGQAAGYRVESMAVVSDRNGRPRYKVFRFVP